MIGIFFIFEPYIEIIKSNNQKSNFMKNLIFLLFLFSFDFHFAFSQLNFDQGLVGHFRFEDNANDFSVIDQDGIVNNCTTTVGINGSHTYSFNGTDSEINFDNDNRGITDQVSISVWIKTSTFDYNWIVGKYDWTVDKGFFLAVNDGKVHFAGRNKCGNYTSANSSVFVNDNSWHHIVGKINGNVWELWVDCVLDQLFYSNAVTPALDNTEPLALGYYVMGDNNNHLHFDGSIDELRIYNRELTEDETAELCVEKSEINTGTADITEQLPKNNDVVVYPNPTNSLLSIDFHGNNPIRLEICDANGKMMTQTDVDILSTAPYTIDISEFEKGVYFLTLFYERQKTVQKIIKE